MGDVDALGLVPVGEATLLQPWVAFKLVHCRDDGAVLKKTFHL